MRPLPPLPLFRPDLVNRNHPLNRGRIAWWLALPGLDGGRQWHDLMGMYSSTLNNMTTAASGWRATTRPGGHGHLLLDGVNDYITTSIPAATLSGSYSVSFWLRNTNVGGVNGYLMNLRDSTRDHAVIWNYVAGKYESFFSGGGGRLVMSATTDSDWHHAGFTWDGTTVSVYWDGRFVTSAASPNTAITSNTTPFLGASSSTADFTAFATDDFSLWSRALSSTEWREVYDLSRMGYPGVMNTIPPPLFLLTAGAAGGVKLWLTERYAQRMVI